MKRLLLLALIFCFALACSGGGGENVLGPFEANMTGTWEFAITVTGGPATGEKTTAVAAIVQSGPALTGTWELADGRRGSLEGTVLGHSLTLELTQSAPCPGTYKLFGTILFSSNKIVGNYSGSDCLLMVQVDFTATKR